MILVLALLLLQTDPAGEIRDLIRTLNSDVPEERERAAGRLKEIGAPAMKPLEEVAKTGDAELRGRARDILDHLARVERIRAFRPSGKKIDVDLKDVPMKEAVRRALDPFGLTGVRVEESLDQRRVSLSIQKASLWEVVEGLAKASKLSFDVTQGLFWEIAGSHPSWFASGEARVSFEGWGYSSNGKGNVKRSVNVSIGLPRGAWACDAELEELEVLDGTGLKIDHQGAGRLEFLRRNGLPTVTRGSFIRFEPKDLKGVKKITVNGTLKLTFPTEIDPRAITGLPGKVSVPGGEVEISRLRKGLRGEWEFSAGLSSEGTSILALVSVEDEAGRWLGDLTGLFINHSGSSSTSTSVTLGEGIPRRGAVLLVTGKEAVREKFRLTFDVPSGD